MPIWHVVPGGGRGRLHMPMGLPSGSAPVPKLGPAKAWANPCTQGAKCLRPPEHPFQGPDGFVMLLGTP